MSGLVIVVGLIVAVVMLPGGPDESGAPTASPPGGAVQVAGVEVSESLVDLGHVPLDTLVISAFVLKNVDVSRAMIDTPSIEVLEGC